MGQGWQKNKVSGDSNCNSKILKIKMQQSTQRWQKQQQQCVGNSTVSDEGDCNSDSNNQWWEKQQQQLLPKKFQQSTSGNKNSNSN